MAGYSFNKVILIGNLTADPELKMTQTGIPVTTFSIAVGRRYAKETDEVKADFINIVCWRKSAEFVAKYFSKGKKILIEGQLQTRSYMANDGTKRTVCEVVADNVSFVESSGSGTQGAGTAQNGAQGTYMPQGSVPYAGTANAAQGSKYTQAAMTEQTPPENDLTVVGDEEDLPF
nr:MAG TPA: Single strand binding protein [Caudoviricetes sp.]